jgi:RNA polymerase sigma factor (sigma-70 family)
VSSLDQPAKWVFVVAARSSYKALRRRDVMPRVLNSRSSAPTVGDPAVSVVNHQTVIALLAQLPPRQRAAVALRYGADMRVQDIALVMRCSPGTVKATLHNALERLRIVHDGTDSSNAD